MVSQIKIVSGLTGTAVACARSEIFFEISALPRGSHALIDAVIESSGFNFISRFSILIYQSTHTHVYTFAFRSSSNTLSRASIYSSFRVYIYHFQRWCSFDVITSHYRSENFFFFYVVSKRRAGKLIHAHSPQLTSTIFLEHVTHVFLRIYRFLPSIFDIIFPEKLFVCLARVLSLCLNRKVTYSTRISMSKTIRIARGNRSILPWNNLVQSVYPSLSLSLSQKIDKNFNRDRSLQWICKRNEFLQAGNRKRRFHVLRDVS